MARQIITPLARSSLVTLRVADRCAILPAGHRLYVRPDPMLKVISQVLALAVAAIVAGALFVTAMTVWSWWQPAGPVSGDVTSPPAATSAPLGR